MPRLPNTIHECGNTEVNVCVFPPKPDNHGGFATIDLLAVDEYDRQLEMYFRNLDEIREFHRKLGEAIRKHEPTGEQLADRMLQEHDILERLGEQGDGTFKVGAL